MAASEHGPEKRQARGDVVNPSRHASAERSPDGHGQSLRGLHRTIEIVPPIKQFIRLGTLVLGPLVLGALVLEAKHDLRVNAPAIVEFDRD
jgi:hypothetical protein